MMSAFLLLFCFSNLRYGGGGRLQRRGFAPCIDDDDGVVWLEEWCEQ